MRARIVLSLAALFLAIGTFVVAEFDRGAAAQTAPIDVGLGEFAFNPAELAAASGPIAFNLSNVDSRRHNMIVDVAGTAFESETVAAGGTGVFSVTIDQPGMYDFWCGVSNHRERGMVGKLTVQ